MAAAAGHSTHAGVPRKPRPALEIMLSETGPGAKLVNAVAIEVALAESRRAAVAALVAD